LGDSRGKSGAEACDGDGEKDDTLDKHRCHRRPPLREREKEREWVCEKCVMNVYAEMFEIVNVCVHGENCCDCF